MREGIGEHAHEQAHRGEGRLLRRGSELTGGLGQASCRQCAVSERNAAIGIERICQCVADRLLVAVQPIGDRKVQDQVEIGVVSVIAQRGVEVRRQVGVDQGGKGAADATGRGEDGVGLADITPAGEHCGHGGPAECRRARDIRMGRHRRIELDKIDRAGLEGETSVDRHEAAGRAIAGRKRSTGVDSGAADRATAGQRAAAVDGGITEHALDIEHTAVHGGPAGIGVGSGDDGRAARRRQARGAADAVEGAAAGHDRRIEIAVLNRTSGEIDRRLRLGRATEIERAAAVDSGASACGPERAGVGQQQLAAIDRRAAGISVDARQYQRAGAELGQRAARPERLGDGEGVARVGDVEAATVHAPVDQARRRREGRAGDLQDAAVERDGLHTAAEIGVRRHRECAGVDGPARGLSGCAAQRPGRAAGLVEGAEALILRGGAELRHIEACRAAAAELEGIAAGAEHIARNHRTGCQRQRVAPAGEPDRRATADAAGIEDRRTARAGRNSNKPARDAGAGIVGHRRGGAGKNAVRASADDAAGVGDIGDAVGVHSKSAAHDVGASVIGHRHAVEADNAVEAGAGDAPGIDDVGGAAVGDNSKSGALDAGAGVVDHRRVSASENAIEGGAGNAAGIGDVDSADAGENSNIPARDAGAGIVGHCPAGNIDTGNGAGDRVRGAGGHIDGNAGFGASTIAVRAGAGSGCAAALVEGRACAGRRDAAGGLGRAVGQRRTRENGRSHRQRRCEKPDGIPRAPVVPCGIFAGRLGHKHAGCRPSVRSTTGLAMSPRHLSAPGPTVNRGWGRRSAQNSHQRSAPSGTLRRNREQAHQQPQINRHEPISDASCAARDQKRGTRGEWTDPDKP